MKNILLVFLILFASLGFSQSVNHYWVYFEKNNGSDLSPKDLPVNEKFLKVLQKQKGVHLIGSSKWFNAAYISCAQESRLKQISKLPFVTKVEKSHRYKIEKHASNFDSLNYGQADVQISMLGLQNFHKQGYTGKGIVLALFDAGFKNLDSLVAFDSLFKRNGILATRDFVTNTKNVFDDDEHGMYVLSLISGYYKDSLNGSAPEVSLLLARTEEQAKETHLEEFNWIKALEWADSIGVDIIHSSLGYSVFDSLQGNYTYQDMDGESTIITRAAQMAFERGIFVSNSAGNEGNSAWKYITAPCDGKNVLCVGSVDSFRQKSKFSSFGPSSDGRVKPDVMAMGDNVTIMGLNNIMRRGGGTSFSGPIMAGFVACLKQKYPTVDNFRLLESIRKSADLYDNPNDSMGYGIPDIERADSILKRILKIEKRSFNKAVKLFPNPCNNLVQIECDFELKSYGLYDVSGKNYPIEIKNKSINMEAMHSGIYFLNLRDQFNNSYWLRFIKN